MALARKSAVGWIVENKEWLFSGLGISVICFFAWLFKSKPPRTDGVDLGVKALTDRLQEKMGEVAGLEQENKQLKEAAEALAAQKGPGIAEALAELGKGGTEKAEEIFQRILDVKKAEGEKASKEAAAAARHIGALAYLHDTEKALKTYRQAVDLDPDDPDGWNRLGQLLARIGDLDQARKAFEKVLSLGNRVKDKAVITAATSNLGQICWKHGDLDKAEEHCLKSLELSKELDRKEGLASDYGNLGLICQSRGDLDKAEEHCLKSLKINKELGRKEGMANQYGNLGLIYLKRGDLDKAEDNFNKVLEIDLPLGRKESIANAYGGLGGVANERSDKAKACQYWAQALGLFEDVGAKPKVEQVKALMADAGC